MLKRSIINNFVKLLKGGCIKSCGGRNNTGVITAFHRGGANKTRYRYIDFWRKLDSTGGVISISYDPGRTALLASVFYFNGYISSIIATKTLTIGSRVFSGANLIAARDIYFTNSERAKDTYKRKIYACGNAFTLSIIPVGSTVNCVELYKSYGAQLVRSAGTFALLYRKTRSFAYLKLRSGWRVVLPLGLMATLGTVSNVIHQTVNLKSAGRNRSKGWRPVVRGVAMNPVDHPHGGGQGHTSGGPKPKSPWGKLTKWRATVSKRVRKQKKLMRFFLEN